MKNLIIQLILIATSLLFSFHVIGQNTEAYFTYGSSFLPLATDGDKGKFTLSGEDFNGQWPINHNKPGIVAIPDGKQSFLSSRGAFTIGYNVRKGKHTIGGMFIMERQFMTHQTNQYEFDNEGQPVFASTIPWADTNLKNFQLAIRYDYNWIFKDKLKMYSGLSAGGNLRRAKTLYYQVRDFQNDFDEIIEDFHRDTETKLFPHLHLNAIGLRFGGIWAAMIELGIGNRGYVNVGINHQLFASEKWRK